jgi:hypothetical protein
MYRSVDTGLNTFNFIRKQFLQGFSQQIAQVVLFPFLFMFFSFKTVG